MKLLDLLEYQLSKRQKQGAIDSKATIIVSMPPKIFLDLTTSGDIEHIKDRTMPKEFYQDLMNKEKIIVHPFLSIKETTGQIVSHEGRARALAAMEAGDNEYEVAIQLWPPGRKLSLKDVPDTWIGQFDKKKRISFTNLVDRGIIKILDDYVQRQYADVIETKNLKENILNQEIDPSILKSIENKLDNLYKNIGIDIRFTRHFVDRTNDPRNKKPITVGELISIFDKVYKKYANKLAKVPDQFEAVMMDISSMLNIPFIITWDDKNNEFDLVAKTIMRKKGFHTPDPKLQVENKLISELYVFNKQGQVVDSDFDDKDIYKRCTNLTLKAFGICSQEKLFNSLYIIKQLTEAGYNILDLSLLKMQYESFSSGPVSVGSVTHAPSEERPLTGKFKGKYYNWSKLKPFLDAYERGITIQKFMNSVPNGRFIIDSSGHSMALIHGKLYDYERKGPNKRRLISAYMVLTDSEMMNFLQDTSTFNKSEKINEAKTAPLYHSTSPESAAYILKNNSIKANTLHTVNKKEVMGVSLTRDLKFAQYYPAPDLPKIIFQLDQQKLSNNKKIVPVDYFSSDADMEYVDDENGEDEFNKLRRKGEFAEAEEFVIGDIFNLDGVVTGVLTNKKSLEWMQRTPRKFQNILNHPKLKII